MNNNYLDNTGKNSVSFWEIGNYRVCLIGLATSFFACHQTNAQMVNTGAMKIDPDTPVAVFMDFENTATGNLINDGNLYIFENWKNDGLTGYTENLNGTTYYTGEDNQFIEGAEISNLKNVKFENVSSLVPFHLSGKIAVGGNSEFNKGVVMAADYGGKMIFRENAVHSQTSDLSFVDGQVEKDGKVAFEFPVGAGNYFRPNYQAALKNEGIYTSQYFHKNSAVLHSHDNRVPEIEGINAEEYWEVTQDPESTGKIVLSLSMDSRTTPSQFFNVDESKYQVVITRWDAASGKWVNEGGAVSDPLAGKPYEKLLTAQVSGYGLFTMALVKKTPDPDPDVTIYNALSPNDDGLNDSFVIKGIDNFPDNEVEIYNRWGVKVYDAKSYNESDNMFRGYSDGRATVKRGDKLPTGTYFYILKYNTGKEVKERTGYLYINNQ